MRIQCLLLPGVLLLTSVVHSSAQTVAVPETTASLPVADVSPATAKPNKFLLKVGLNIGRAITLGGYDGFLGRVPL